MKDEIKEILDILKYCVEKNEYLEVPNMKDWKPLLDYITTLQEENENLKSTMEELCEYAKKSDKLEIRNGMLRNENKELKEENERLNNIIKEAREYIKEHICNDMEYPDYMEITKKEYYKLLEILDKENKDE